MNALESLLYETSKFFLTPVLVLLCAMFVYALFALGAFVLDLALRRVGGAGRQPLAAFRRRHPDSHAAAVELHLLKLLEPLRIVSRVAPMLGLVATMIPMGPALVAVSSGNAQGIAQNLVVAFAAVIVALMAAAITYTVLSVRRRWLLAELNALMHTAPEVVHG
ncbi:MAG: MotA/TolQ/ExbB proton channel family protein [Burkholderiales bacterium]|nr:MotA/TolQ/ExbB proton channel family protein [Burkholderiales bacterium]